MQTRYRIYSLSARAILSYAQAEDDRYFFRLSRKATEKCKVYGGSDVTSPPKKHLLLIAEYSKMSLSD